MLNRKEIIWQNPCLLEYSLGCREGQQMAVAMFSAGPLEGADHCFSLVRLAGVEDLGGLASGRATQGREKRLLKGCRELGI
jgi:hypothetical protein